MKVRHRRPSLVKLALCIFLISFAAPLSADGLQDNLPDQVRPVPPPGIEVSDADRNELERELIKLDERIQGIRKSPKPPLEFLPDVEIFYRAVQDALAYQEFFSPQEIQAGKDLLREGLLCAEQLAGGHAPWAHQTGLVVRGYVSRIDHSVQPYGLVIPSSYSGGAPTRMDVWLHGRGETLSELAFLNQRMHQVGQISPRDTIVLHPYGRYCNAFKFAGEIDVLESMAAVQTHYRIDEDRISIRGFSMGGAGCWQMAVHYPDLWFAANPGAGFAETLLFLQSFQKENVVPTPWEKTLWQWYDCPGYAANLVNCPTVAYSGELDTQKQAADVMEQALRAAGITLTHLIGPQTKHSIHPDTGKEVERRLASVAVKGRNRAPHHVELNTYTLKYNRAHWLTITGLEQHWKLARIEATLASDSTIQVCATNVASFRMTFPPGWWPFDVRGDVNVILNGQNFVGPRPQSDRSWDFEVVVGGNLKTPISGETKLRKQHDLQGPIDDAFMDTFLVVRPTGKARNPEVDEWTQAEYDHLVREWRRHFRGQAMTKDDTAVTDDDIRSANLILFGDPQSNAIIRRVTESLPIGWTNEAVRVGAKTFDPAHHAPILIYPNPLNPNRYVVLNSGFTFREYDYLNNARQVSRLPDWAVVDLRTKPNAKYSGKIVDAGFFDEQWKLTP